MKRMTIPAMLVAAVLAFTLAGCSGGTGGGQAMSADTLKGTWELDSQSELGFDAYLNFPDDSNVEMIINESWLDGTWSVSGADGSVSVDGRTVKMSYNDNKLTLGGTDGSKLVFVKSNDEEIAAFFEGSAEGEGAEIQELEYVDEVINPIDPVVIADDANYNITVTASGTDFTGDPGYQVSITNKTDKAIFVTYDEAFTAAGTEVEPGIGDEVEAGGTLETFIYFDKAVVGDSVEALGSVDGTIVILDDETEEEVARYPFHM